MLGGAFEPGADRLLLIKGVPDAFSVDDAVKVGQSWGVSFAGSLTKLRLVPANTYQDNFTLEVQVLEGGEPKGKAIAHVDYRQAAPAAEKPAPANAPIETAAVPPPIDKELHARGDNLLAQGDIQGARSIYEHLAANGDWLAARKMGQTYDPAFLKNKFLIGIQPDSQEAFKWYAKSEELGYRDQNPAVQAAGK